jgi:CRP/FNR family transcriptional regulator, cyclic AMP receptor protein
LKAAKGEKIFDQGKQARSLYYLLSGSVVIRVSTQTGSDAMVMDLPPGHFMPMTALLGEGVRYVADGIAQSNCDLVVIEITQLRKLLLKDINVSNYFLEISLERTELIVKKFLDAALLSATGRIAKCLLDIAHPQRPSLHDGAVIELNVAAHVSRLAATASMARETASRQLSWLERQGIIARSKKSVTLLDVARLHALVDGNLIAASRKKGAIV